MNSDQPHRDWVYLRPERTLFLSWPNWPKTGVDLVS